jgi:aryl-alcohol dehydrogenase-like predicted oxidoreductase
MGSFAMRRLGKTDLQVSPLGIGGGNGISSPDLLYAFEHGINYFFFSSDLHHFSYRRSVDAIRTLCRQGSTVRDQVVLATVSYLNDPEKLPAILSDQFGELGIEYIDVFHWGWMVDDREMLALLKKTHQLKGESVFVKQMRQLQIVTQRQQEQAEAINEGLLQRGLVRYVGTSFHSRAAARRWMRNLDVMMLRYNIARRDIEEDIVPFLYGEKERDPGIVVFNVAHEGQYHFHIPPPGYPSGGYVPSIPDCYRFALSNSWVDLVLTGPRNRKEIDLALSAIEQGPLSGDEKEALCRYGAFYQQQLHAVPL